MMNSKKQKKSRAGVDVLYKVDPQKLSIKTCYTSTTVDRIADYTTTFENFSYEVVVEQPEIPEQIEHLPAQVDGVFYFATEQEALNFIRQQIGI